MNNIELLPQTVMVIHAMLILPFTFYAVSLYSDMIMKMEDELDFVEIKYYKLEDFLNILLVINSGCISIPVTIGIVKLIFRILSVILYIFI